MAGVIVMAATDSGAGITKYEVTWVSDAAGAVNGSTFNMKSGTIISVEFVPGSGALAPTDLYDVDLEDEHGVSMFDNGAGTTIGANLSSVAASHAVPLFGLTGTSLFRRWHQGGAVELQVAGAGDSNAGTVAVYVVNGVI